MSPTDVLAKRVEELNAALDKERRLNQSLRAERAVLSGKKDLKPKKAMSLDRQSVRMITSHVGAPAGLAGGVQYVFYLILEDVGASTFLGLSIDHFWVDPQISGGVVAGLTLLFATVYKFLRRYS